MSFCLYNCDGISVSIFSPVSFRMGFPDFGSIYSDFLFKFLVIGSAGTGKSCLLHQFIENKCECLGVVSGAPNGGHGHGVGKWAAFGVGRGR